MTVVLGIDAAWTERGSSGIALVAGSGGRWRSVAVAPSYPSFIARAKGVALDWSGPALQGSVPRASDLLSAAKSLARAEVDIVAVDMPLSTMPIKGRRAADSAVSREFGGRGCATHSPSCMRPGPLSDRLRAEFEEAGYRLATVGDVPQDNQPYLVEVYPHVAVLALLGAASRVPYKVAKMRKYWPRLDRHARIVALLAQWGRLRVALEEVFGDCGLHTPDPEAVRTLSGLKPHEDCLDALVCAWVGVRFASGRARPCGDDTAAIWVPDGMP